MASVFREIFSNYASGFILMVHVYALQENPHTKYQILLEPTDRVPERAHEKLASVWKEQQSCAVSRAMPVGFLF